MCLESMAFVVTKPSQAWGNFRLADCSARHRRNPTCTGLRTSQTIKSANGSQAGICTEANHGRQVGLTEVDKEGPSHGSPLKKSSVGEASESRPRSRRETGGELVIHRRFRNAEIGREAPPQPGGLFQRARVEFQAAFRRPRAASRPPALSAANRLSGARGGRGSGNGGARRRAGPGPPAASWPRR